MTQNEDKQLEIGCAYFLGSFLAAAIAIWIGVLVMLLLTHLGI